MRTLVIAACAVFSASTAYAHVTVLPRESHAGVEQRYSVRVPTEGEGYSFDVRREGDRIVAIIWKREIPPRQLAEFAFVARNPNAAEIAWKARQRFADGTSADWVGVQGDRRPASVTRLSATKK